MDTEVTQPPPQPAQVTTQVTTVTKQKSPGRIQAGKKLAEWNRNNKQKLRENKEMKSTEEITEESKHESPVAVQNKRVITVVGFVTGASVVAYMLYRKWNSTKQRSTKQTPLSEKQTTTQPEEKHTKSMSVTSCADQFCMQ